MSKLKFLLSKSYIFIILLLFYIPLTIGAVYSFSASPRKGEMATTFTYTGEGWHKLLDNQKIGIAILNSVFISILVAIVVSILSLITVYGLWRQKNRTIKSFVAGTYNIPLINPDIITGVMLASAFGVMFGGLQIGDDGAERVIIAQIVMVIPFGITLMIPRSSKFKLSYLEASKDLGFGPIKTWFKTYFRHMLPVVAAVFIISVVLSFDDFIITRTTSTIETVGKLMYETQLKPWVLAMGTIVLTIALTSIMIVGFWSYYKTKRRF